MNYELTTSESEGLWKTLTYTLRIRLAVVLLMAVSLFAACGSKPPPRTSNHKAQVAKPAQPASSDYEQILSAVKSIVAGQLSLDAGAVDVDVPLAKQKVAADELDVVEIIMSVEEAFGVEIKDEEVSHPEGHLKDGLSVRKLAEIVAGKKKGNN